MGNTKGPRSAAAATSSQPVHKSQCRLAPNPNHPKEIANSTENAQAVRANIEGGVKEGRYLGCLTVPGERSHTCSEVFFPWESGVWIGSKG